MTIAQTPRVPARTMMMQSTAGTDTPSTLPTHAPSPTSRILAPIGAGAAGAGLMYLWARNGPAKLRLGLMLFGAAAGAGLVAMHQAKRAAEVHPYLVSFSTQPDYSHSDGTPTSAYNILMRHFAKVSPPVESKLGQLKTAGTVKSYEGIPISNGYIVDVRNDKVATFEREMHSTPNVGTIEQGDT